MTVLDLLLALKSEEGATHQGKQVPLEAEKDQRNGFSSRASRRNQPCPHLKFISVKLVSHV